MVEHKTYLGDSVYAAMKDGMIMLTTENGLDASNTIYLELEVFEALILFVNHIAEIYAAAGYPPTKPD